ncbi:MAG: hypothetical protein FWD73_14020 [Polyangiaceae bacterium]|nr:hypothetical protein [Polyangiaceae bacterium]
MLSEQYATSYSHDPAQHVIIVVCETGPRSPLRGELPARLLLDAALHLVGIDVAPDTPDRLVMMLGAHENVAQVVDNVRVHIENGGRTVLLHGPFANLVAAGANPYVP